MADELPTIDVLERAGVHTGEPQELASRLFMQLLVFDCAAGVKPDAAVEALAHGLGARGAKAVIYSDMNAPGGLAVLSWSEDPSDFVTKVGPALIDGGDGLVPRNDFTMVGRTYATGYEPDLKHWLINRPIETVNNDAWPWAVWYPLRRSGAFAQLPGKERGTILREHATIGRAYGAQDLAHDVRLACHGLDAVDNEFVIGLIGKDLHPLSHVVEAMRKTRQTAEYIAKMGPFFVGHVAKRVG